MSNPFSLTYDALWDCAEASTELTGLVRLSNRIKLVSEKVGSPFKDQISQADLPELLLVQTTGSANLHQTSNSSSIIKQYDWLISTGELSSISVMALEWVLFAAMTNWKEYLGGLTWNDASFIKRAQITGISSGLTDTDRNRGVRGWSSIWGVEIEMHFPTATLQAVGAPTTTVAPTTT